MRADIDCATRLYEVAWLSDKSIKRTDTICAYLMEKGYGDVKQAVIKYADKLALHIAGHSNYRGDNILSAIYALAEEKDIKDVQPLNLEEIRKQAVREFAEKLKNTIEKNIVCYPSDANYAYNEALTDVIAFIEKLV